MPFCFLSSQPSNHQHPCTYFSASAQVTTERMWMQSLQHKSRRPNSGWGGKSGWMGKLWIDFHWLVHHGKWKIMWIWLSQSWDISLIIVKLPSYKQSCNWLDLWKTLYYIHLKSCSCGCEVFQKYSDDLSGSEAQNKNNWWWSEKQLKCAPMYGHM